MTTIEKDVQLPAAAGSQRLSIFGGWCRLLVCLALLAAVQQCVRYLGTPQPPVAALPSVPRSVSAHEISQLTVPGLAGPQPHVLQAPRFMVDVNHALQHELEALPEVGPGLATRIVQFRQAQGPFQDIDDLLQVRGVGPLTLQQLRPMLLLGPATSPNSPSIR